MNASFLFDVTAMVRDGRDDPEPVLLPLQQNEYRVIQFCVANAAIQNRITSDFSLSSGKQVKNTKPG